MDYSPSHFLPGFPSGMCQLADPDPGLNGESKRNNLVFCLKFPYMGYKVSMKSTKSIIFLRRVPALFIESKLIVLKVIFSFRKSSCKFFLSSLK